MGLQLPAWVKKTVHGVKSFWLSNKKKSSVKKGMLLVFRDMKGHTTIDFCKKCSTVTVQPIANTLGRIHIINWLNVE